MMAFSSLYWLSGFGTLMVTTLSEMTRVLTTEVFQPELMLRIIEKHKVRPSITQYFFSTFFKYTFYHRLV